jgi:hypothetical protein
MEEGGDCVDMVEIGAAVPQRSTTLEKKSLSLKHIFE